MARTHYLFKQLVSFIAAIVAGTCAPSTAQIAPFEVHQDCSSYTAVPLPAEAERELVPKTPPACGSYRSYRGIGRTVNYSEARACAWRERRAQKAELGQSEKEPIAWVVGGSLILADIYFNGAGVERNIPLAIRFACESEESMAALALPAIAKLKGSSPAPAPFEFCDYAATTFTMNFCNGYEAEIEDDRRNRYYNSLKSSMTPEQRAAFENLLAAENRYIEAHASEVDQGGTIRVVRTIGSQRILKDLFRTEVVHFERKNWPALSDNQISNADAAHDREYLKALERLRSQTKELIDQGGVTADHLSQVEETWQTYREAWVAFARLRYPRAVASIRAEIILDRCRLLKTVR